MQVFESNRSVKNRTGGRLLEEGGGKENDEWIPKLLLLRLEYEGELKINQTEKKKRAVAALVGEKD